MAYRVINWERQGGRCWYIGETHNEIQQAPQAINESFREALGRLTVWGIPTLELHAVQETEETVASVHPYCG